MRRRRRRRKSHETKKEKKVQPVSSVLFLFNLEASLAAMREEPLVGLGVGTTLRPSPGRGVKGKNHPRAGFTNQSIQPTSLMAGSNWTGAEEKRPPYKAGINCCKPLARRMGEGGVRE